MYQENQNYAGDPQQHICPNCGYCPSCGRRYPYYPAPYIVPTYPIYPNYPEYWYPKYTITCSSVPATVASGAAVSGFSYQSSAIGKNDFKVG